MSTRPEVPTREMSKALKYVRALICIYWRVNRSSLTRDDIEGAAHDGFADALESWNPARGATFSSHAYRRIRGAILDAFASRSRYESRYRPLGTADRINDGNLEDRIAVNQALEALPEGDRRVIVGCLIEGHRLHELGLHKSSAFRLVQRSLEKMRRRLTD